MLAASCPFSPSLLLTINKFSLVFCVTKMLLLFQLRYLSYSSARQELQACTRHDHGSFHGEKGELDGRNYLFVHNFIE